MTVPFHHTIVPGDRSICQAIYQKVSSGMCHTSHRRCVPACQEDTLIVINPVATCTVLIHLLSKALTFYVLVASEACDKRNPAFEFKYHSSLPDLLAFSNHSISSHFLGMETVSGGVLKSEGSHSWRADDTPRLDDYLRGQVRTTH